MDKLPDNWVKKQSKSRPDKEYYFNVVTGVSSWTKPPETTIKLSSKLKSPKKDNLRSLAPQSNTVRKNVASDRLKKLQTKLSAERAIKDKQIIADVQAKKKKNSLQESPTVHQTPRKPSSKKEVASAKTASPSKKKRKHEGELKPDKIDKHNNNEPPNSQEDGKSLAKTSFKIPKKTKIEHPIAQEPEKVQNETVSVAQSIGGRLLSAIINLFPSKKEKNVEVSAPTAIPSDNTVTVSPPVRTQSSSIYDVGKRQQPNFVAFTPETPKARSSPSSFGIASQRLNKFRESLVLQQEISVDEDVLMEEERCQSSYISTENQQVEMMDWEEIPEEVILKEIQEIRETTLHTTVSRSFVPTRRPSVLPVRQNCTDNYFIVVDTNVFLSHLKFISAFSVRKLKGIAQLKLIVPYTVLQELDKLKHRRSDDLSLVASRVIKFLNEKFSNSEDWIQGQSPVTANNNKLIEIENPDDNILNCCLQLKQKTDKILLLSNDVNLRNKALFSAVLAYSKDQFEYEADNLHRKFL